MTNGVELEIDDSWEPNEYSIEEAIVFAVSKSQQKFKVGDKVIVDFSIFTAGLYKHKYKTAAESRCVFKSDSLLLYWCYDDQHEINNPEIFAQAKGEQIIPVEGIVLIEPPNKNGWEKEQSGLFLYHYEDRKSNPFFACVFASGDPRFKKGDTIFVEAGMSVEVRFRNSFKEYVPLTYILGKINPATKKLELF